MSQLIVDEVMLREPNLLIPRKKPVGPVRVNPDKADGLYASYLFAPNTGWLKALKGPDLTASFALSLIPKFTQYGAAGNSQLSGDYYSATTHEQESEFTREILWQPVGDREFNFSIATTAETPGNATRDRSLSVTDTNKFTAYVYNGAAQILTGTTTIALNTQYHVAVTVGSAGFRLYVNGVLEDSDAAVTTAYTGYTTPELVLGYGDQASVTRASSGYVFMFNDWTVALSDAEIAERANDPYQILIPA